MSEIETIAEICMVGPAQFDDATKTISYATFDILTGGVKVREEVIEDKKEYFKRKLQGE